MKRHAMLLAAAVAAASLPAVSLAVEAKLIFGTGLDIDGITFTPHAFNLNWNGFGALGRPDLDTPDEGAGEAPGRLLRHFILNTGTDDAPVFSGTGTFSEASDGGIRAEWRVTPDKSGRFAEAFVGGDIPFSRIGGGVAILDGEELPIPATRGAVKHLFRKPVSNIELRGSDGATILRIALDEPTPILLQDNRHWKGTDLGLRLYFAYSYCEAGKEYAVKAKFFTGDAGAERLSLAVADPVRITAGPDWLPLAREPWIEPGTALDFSSVIPHHEPAGKFGRVVVRGGHFEFENLPGVPQRFYGVNLCSTANMPNTAEEAERFAAHLARMGYNTVRIHHHERWLVREDGKLPEDGALGDRALPVGADRRAARTGGSGAEPPSFVDTALDPALIDKLDILVAACIRHGIYLTTDLYVSRGHVIPWRAIGIDKDGPVRQDSYKLLCAFWEPAYSNLCAWSRNFMTHRNPYTGRTLAEEPALATLALVNEGNLGNFGASALRELPCVQEAWKTWLDAKRNEKWKMEKGNKDGEEDAGHSSFSISHSSLDDLYSQPAAEFLADTETRLYERLRDFVRDELHCPVPLSNLSGWYDPVQSALPRSKFDYIDAHFYVDHPQFLGKPWRLPSRCPNQNPMRGDNRGVQECVWRRQMDKPFCVTEFNFSGPGRFRGVGGIATGAIAALQDWGGLWRFAWSHARGGITAPGGQMGYFDLSNDPLSLAAERAALCLFLRGDISPLEAEEPIILDAAALRDPANGAPKLATLGDSAKAWEAKVGTTFDGSRKRSNAIESKAVSIDPSSGTFLIDTPRTCGGFAESGVHTAGPLRFEILASTNHSSLVTRHSSLRGGDSVAATIWISSLDGAPIATSSHLLLTHLTDVQNSGIEYADPGLTILLNWGKLPHLMRNGAAEIELTLSESAGGVPPSLAETTAATGGCRVYRLSPGGRRLGEVPATFDPATGRLAFTARTDYTPDTATYLYEIER